MRELWGTTGNPGVSETAVRGRFHPKTVDIWLPSGRKPRLPDGRGLLTVIADPTADRGVAVLIGEPVQPPGEGQPALTPDPRGAEPDGRVGVAAEAFEPRPRGADRFAGA